MGKRSFNGYIKERSKDRLFMCVLLFYIVFCLVSAIYWCVNWHARDFFMSVGYMLFVPAIFVVEYLLNIRSGVLFTASLLFIAVGSILGCCFNLYSIIPFFDTALHGLSGVLFGALGFSLAEKCFGKAKNNSLFCGCLIFAFCFSLAIATVWEIFEYTCTAIFGFDMMEDTIVTEINSYLLSGAHTEMVEIEGITKTIIYLENGQTYIINGYLDIGLIDTLTDMIICFIGTMLFGIIAIVSHKRYPKINNILIPQVVECTEIKE